MKKDSRLQLLRQWQLLMKVEPQLKQSSSRALAQCGCRHGKSTAGCSG
jgi:hypothetical protein